MKIGKDISDKLAESVKGAIDLKNEKNENVTVKINVVNDTDSAGSPVFVDRFATRSLEANDIKAIAKMAPELTAGLLGHVLEEYSKAETQFRRELLPEGAAEKATETLSHTRALFTERDIISNLTGKQLNVRDDSQSGNVVKFFYGDIHYDIVTKSATGAGANAIESVRRTTSKQAVALAGR